MIPKILHFVWFGPPMPDWVKQNIEGFRRLNPDYELRLHGEDILLPEYATAYVQLDNVCSKSDLLALSALRRWGGWALDTDYVPFRPIADIVNAYMIDGSRMVVTEQHGQHNLALKVANGLLASTPDCRAWAPINEYIAHSQPPFGRCHFGPILFTKLVPENPAAFQLCGWPWFYPADIANAPRIYRAYLRYGPRAVMRCAPTGGQLPFMMHLWTGGSTEVAAHKPPDLIEELQPDAENQIAPDLSGRRACLAYLEAQWRDQTQPFQAIAEGLRRIGVAVEVWRLGPQPPPLDTVDLMFVWNGRKDWYLTAARAARDQAIPVVSFEHGFFDRRSHVHMDHRGILHWTSWAHDWDRAAPPDAAERFRAVWPSEFAQFTGRQGYILVLGQLDGDTQLQDSEVQVALQLQKFIQRNLAPGVAVKFRPHPNARTKPKHYLPICEAPTLRESVEGAKFAVMINSNAGNECLAWGCPVLCFGPALYANAGVAKTCTVPTLREKLIEMLKGWHPDPDKVRNYLYWLVSRQYSDAELRQGAVLAPIVRKALA